MKRSKKRLALLLAAMMAFSLVPVVAGAAPDASSVTVNVPSVFTVGKEAEFTVTTNVAAADNGKMVLGYFDFSNPEAIDSVYYWNVNTNDWSVMPLDQPYGPAATGFPLTDGITSRFKVTFKTAGNYTLKVDMKLKADETLVSTSGEQQINVEEASSVTINAPQFTVGQEAEFTVTTNVSTADAGKMVLGYFDFSNPEAIDSIYYKDGEEWKVLPLDIPFGPQATGFPLTDDTTSHFKVTFKTAGDYTLKVDMKLKADETLVSTSGEQAIKVVAAPVGVATIQLPEGGFTVNEKGEFTVSVKANGDAGKEVVEVIVFGNAAGDALTNDKVASLEVFINGEWKAVELMEVNGVSGFVVNGQTLVAYADKDLKFRVAFKEAGDYMMAYGAVGTDVNVMVEGQFTVKTAAVDPTPTPSDPDIPKTGEADYTWVLMMGLALLAGGIVVMSARKHA